MKNRRKAIPNKLTSFNKRSLQQIEKIETAEDAELKLLAHERRLRRQARNLLWRRSGGCFYTRKQIFIMAGIDL